MSEAYDKFVKNKMNQKKRQIPSKFKQHVISFDSEDQSQRSDIPHIFLDQKSEIQEPPKIIKEKKERKEIILSNQPSMQELKTKNISNNSSIKKNQSNKKQMNLTPSKSHDEQIQQFFKQESRPIQPQQQEQQEIAEPEVYVQPHSSLSLIETIQLHLGEFLFRNLYPMKKIIYINNNNEEQNIMNKKDYQMRYKNSGKEILYFNNSIEVSKALFFIIVALRNIFSYFYIYAWVGIIVLQFISQKTFLNGPIQYGIEKVPLIILIIMAMIVQMFSDILSVYKRRKSWNDQKMIYRVYHHNGKMAEWVNTKANEIQPGHIYKVSPGQNFPTDTIALHSEHSFLQIKENHILSMLVQQCSEISLKSILIKGIHINLPLSGFLDYSINTPEYSEFQVVGKLNLQEPEKVSHPINMSNVILRGSINASSAQILCIALETGIDSILLKNLQYPFQHRKVFEQRESLKAKRISDDMSLQIKQHESKIMGWPYENRIESSVIYLIIGYLMLVGIAILIFFIAKIIRSNESFTSSSTISITKIVIYHLTNFIIFIPVLLIPITKLYVLISTSITQSNISKRAIELTKDGDKQRINKGLSSESRQRQDILDNKKIIFPVTIKDYNLLPDLCDINTIVTTIDTFRDQSAFTLHSIRVREQINHNFKTTNMDIYPEPHLDLIKKFMAVAVLSTDNTQQMEAYHYEAGIQVTAKKYLGFQKHKNSKGELELNEYRVKYLFHINAIEEYPYKVIFYKPVIDEQLQFDNNRVLVIIRGNPKVILDKNYGKQVKFTEESRKLYEERGFYVELVCKTQIHINDANEIQKAYKSSQIQYKLFYRNLDKFISKVQPMGLLIFANNFYQKKIIQSQKNPILNKYMMAQDIKENTYKHDIFTNQDLPNIIILCPPSKSSNEEYLSIYTLTNLLRHPCLFNLTLSQVGDKILHEKPNNIEKMIAQLQKEKVLVWNGWDQQQIIYTLHIMKKYGKKHLMYLQKDEFMYLMKESNCSVIGGQKGYDLAKYSDINLTSRSSISYLYLTQLISYDSLIVKQGLLNIYLTQIAKFTFYFIIEFINLFYTRGTGLSVIKSQLFLVVEFVLFIDIFYYLNVKDSLKVNTIDKKESFTSFIQGRIFLTILQSILITFVSFYSLDTPYDSTGTIHSYHATYFCIIFSFLHVLVLQKLFNTIGSSFSFYKGGIILIQILLLYVGFIIVSATDTYYFYGILSEFMNGKALLTSICLIWISLSMPALTMALKLTSEPPKVQKRKTSVKFY